MITVVTVVSVTVPLKVYGKTVNMGTAWLERRVFSWNVMVRKGVDGKVYLMNSCLWISLREIENK